MKRIGVIISTIFVMSLFALTFSNIIQSEPTTMQMNPESRLKIFDSPIAIYNNAALNTTASSGNGTAGFPWIIENKSIDVGGASEHGIVISGTTEHFILRNCTIVNAGGGYNGIALLNLINGIVRNNTIKSSTIGDGINLQTCRAIQLSENIIHNMNQGGGIVIYNSNDTLLSENKISNTSAGIYLYKSHNHRLIHNTIKHITNKGIELTEPNNNNTLSYNIITNCKIGIKISKFTNGTLSYNTVNQNTDDGIEIISDSDNNTLSHNIATDNKHGISVTSSNNNTLINNSAIDNDLYGIYIKGSRFSRLICNNATSNNHSGIYFQSASDGIIYNNTANSNFYYGISLDGLSNYNNITWNTVHHNSICWRVLGTRNVLENNDCFPEEDVNGGGIPGFQWPFLLLALIVATYFIIALSRKRNFKQLF